MKLNRKDLLGMMRRLFCLLVICSCMFTSAAFGEVATPTDSSEAAIETEQGEQTGTTGSEPAQGTEPTETLPASETPPEPAEETTTPAEQPADPMEEPTQPVEEPAEPTEQPTDPTEEPAEPTEEPVTQTEEPVQPTGEPTEQPAGPTEEPPMSTETPVTPVDLETMFKLEIKVPRDWTNARSKNVRIKITPLTGDTWDKVKYRLGDSDWQEIREKFILDDGYYYIDLEVTDNAWMTVRLSLDDGRYMDEKKEIRIFDRTAPVVTAGFNDMLLHVEAPDDLSGAAGVQVNGLLFTTLENGKLDVRMEDVLLSYKQLAIRAYDYAGNFSEPVTLDNPYYVAPTATPKPTVRPTTRPTSAATATPKPTRRPSSSATTNPTKEPVQSVPTTNPTQAPVQQVIVYVTPEPVATPEPIVRTEYVPIGPGQPFTSSGNMQTLDMLYSAATNKQFITVQSKGGQTYYLVIDYDKPIDEENELYETYFLNLVDDRDLMDVLSDEEKEEVPTPTPQIVYVTPEPTTVPTPVTEPEKKQDNSAAILLLALLLLGGGGFALWFFKFRNSKQNTPAPVREYDDDDDYYDDGDEDAGESDE